MAAHAPKDMWWFDPTINFSYGDVPMYKSEDAPKRHTACDECRQRKLKCSGELMGCSRCVKQGLLCHYSMRKQMGRPPKAKTSSSAEAGDSEDGQGAIGNVQDGPMEQLMADLAPDPIGTYEASQTWPAVYKSFMMNTYDLRPGGPFVTNDPIFESREDATTSLEAAAVSEWNPKQPDYSKINPPLVSQTWSSSPLGDSSSDIFSPVQSHRSQGSTTTSTSCSCLSQLYLSLSSLSTLSSFPLSAQTLATLYNAARTARSVIHCPTCPQAFSTGVQNLMMLWTLLAVAGDAWYRVSAMDAESLGRETVCASYLASLPTDPTLRREHWTKWLRDVVRHGVIGASVAPAVHAVQSQCLDSLDLLSLIEQLEDRQRVRHAAVIKEGKCGNGNGNGNGNNDDRDGDYQMGNGIGHSTAETGSGPKDERDYFCMRIVGNARTVIERFGFEPEELRDREGRTRTQVGKDAFAPWTTMG